MKRQTLRFVVRSGLTMAGMLTLYAVFPVPGHRHSLWATVLLAVAGLAVLTLAFLTLAARARRSTEQDAVRLEAVVAVLYAFIVFTSLVYLGLSSTAGQFAGLNNRIDALYFTTSTITTVGFGDIHATGEVSRAVVTLQLFLDVVFVGLVARIILPSLMDTRARRLQARAHQPADETAPAGEPPAPEPSGEVSGVPPSP